MSRCFDEGCSSLYRVALAERVPFEEITKFSQTLLGLDGLEHRDMSVYPECARPHAKALLEQLTFVKPELRCVPCGLRFPSVKHKQTHLLSKKHAIAVATIATSANPKPLSSGGLTREQGRTLRMVSKKHSYSLHQPCSQRRCITDR